MITTSLCLTALLNVAPLALPEAHAPAPAPLPQASGMTVFLYVEGVTGGATHRNYEGWCEAASYSLEVSHPGSNGSGGGGTTGQSTFSDFVVTGQFLRALPRLAIQCARGELLREVRVVYALPAGTDWIPLVEYRLRNVVVTRVATAGDQTPSLLTDVAFDFGRIEWRTSYFDPQRGWRTTDWEGWDLETNQQM